MGEHQVIEKSSPKERQNFIEHLIKDIEALELMLKEGLIEDDIRRIGSEQEFCLLNQNWRPSNIAASILSAVQDTHFTTELAKYNLEINLDPIELKGDCFKQVEEQLNVLMTKAVEVASEFDNKVILAGILPTISKRELDFEFMTSNPRYWALNQMMKELRGSDFELRIRGVDELCIKHESVLFEACNTSFQMHLQIPPQDFISSYNWAQVISGPLLSVCTNSPLLLGRELWSETRIALFQQSIDLRSSSYALKEQNARVTFGNEWATGSIADIYKNDIAIYKVILAKDIEQDSLAELKDGRIPKLAALNVNNGTIYRWNRACYGVGGGKPHIRIENRYVPAGPTRIDELANFAFWVGLMMGRPKKFNNLPEVEDFKVVKSNFIKSARTGMDSIFNWFGKRVSAKKLIIEELLPIAEKGLKDCQIDPKDINKLLGIIKSRTESHTGSQWQVKNYRFLRKTKKVDDALLALTKVIYQNQSENIPVHEWKNLAETVGAHEQASQLQHIMSRQLFTVQENDPAILALKIMEWKNIHHLPVENKSQELAGLLTWRHLNRFLETKLDISGDLVKDIMEVSLYVEEPYQDIESAIKLMKEKEIGCLPIVSDQKLVGIVTIKDLLEFNHD